MSFRQSVDQLLPLVKWALGGFTVVIVIYDNAGRIAIVQGNSMQVCNFCLRWKIEDVNAILYTAFHVTNF